MGHMEVPSRQKYPVPIRNTQVYSCFPGYSRGGWELATGASEMGHRNDEPRDSRPIDPRWALIRICMDVVDLDCDSLTVGDELAQDQHRSISEPLGSIARDEHTPRAALPTDSGCRRTER